MGAAPLNPRRGFRGWQVQAASCLLVSVLASSCSCPHSPARSAVIDGVHTRVSTSAKCGEHLHALRLRGGKSGRRTQPAKVPKEFWTKRYQADWDKLKMRNNRVHDSERGLSRTEHVKIPGSYWAFGQQMPDRAPNMTVGRDFPYEDAHLKSDALLFHPGLWLACVALNICCVWNAVNSVV